MSESLTNCRWTASDAEQAYDQALKVEPRSAYVLDLKAAALMAQQKYSEALKLYSKITLIAPNDPNGMPKGNGSFQQILILFA